MSVQSEIDRIKKNVNDTLKTISDTGVTVGAGSDSLPAAAQALANEKQDKLTGTQGQVVGFDSGGNAVPQDAPQSGMTQEQADQRYLQLAGGVVSGDLAVETGLFSCGDAIIGMDARVNGQLMTNDIWMENRLQIAGYFVSISETVDDERGSTLNINPDLALSLTDKPIKQLADPTDPTDAVTKRYVDAFKPKSTLVTLPLSAWSNNTQTVTVQGVLADESKQLIQPMPTIADQAVYSAAGISCTGQAANKLTFKAQTVPTEDVQVYVVIQEVRT